MSRGVIPEHELIRASAGSGKTFSLAQRYLRLLESGAEPGRVLATTFTRAAAGEIRDRVLGWLVKGSSDAAGLAALNENVGVRLGRERVGVLFDGVLGALPRLPIGTIDSTFHRMASAFAFELGLPERPTLLDEQSSLAEDLRGRSIERLLSERERAETLETLIAWLRRLTSGQATRSVTEEIDRIVKELHGVWVETPVAGLWHFGKHGRRLGDEAFVAAVERLRGCRDVLPKTQKGETQKSYLRALSSAVACAESGEWESLLTAGLSPKVWAGETFDRKEIPEALSGALRPVMEHAIAEVAETIDWRTHATALFLSDYDKAWEVMAARRGAVLYSDMTRLLAQGVVGGDERWLEELRFRTDATTDHLLLDEFQDTSRQQWAVLSPIVDEVLASGPAAESGRSVFCVGDTKQAIYGWRGGDVRLFDQMEKRIEDAGGGNRELSKVWRCSPAVLDLVNAVFMNLTSWGGVESDEQVRMLRDWQGSFPEHEAAHSDRVGYACVERTEPLRGEADDEERSWGAGAGEYEEEVDAPLGAHGADHLRQVAERVKALHDRLPGRSVAVLVSRNRTAGELLLLLRGLGVEASGEGGIPIAGDPAVEAVLSALTLADHPGDLAAAFHVRNSPLGEVVKVPGSDDGLAGWGAGVRGALLASGFGAVLQRWIGGLVGACDEGRWRRLEQLLVMAQRYDLEMGAEPEPAALRPGRFVASVRRQRVEEPSQSAVRVMTVHRSKGMEFDAVVLPDLDQKWIHRAGPAIRRDAQTGEVVQIAHRPPKKLRDYYPLIAQAIRDGEADDLGERLCGLYVAMTRAIHGLYVMLPALRKTAKGGVSKAGVGDRSAASLIRQVLALPEEPEEPDEEGEVLVEFGEAGWAERVERRDVGERVLRRALRAKVKEGRMASVSAASSHGRARLMELFERGRGVAARARGEAVHALLEGVGFVDDELPAWVGDDEAAWALLEASGLDVSGDDVSEWVAEARRAMGMDSVCEVLSRRGAARVMAEVPFARTPAEGTLVVGRIDRLVVWEVDGGVERAEVVDYKTDRVADDEAGRALALERHAAQVGRYCEAAAALLGVDRAAVTGRLLMTLTGDVVDVPSG
ncbi:MAG: UvrD-helicase domain-containing protein [Phycisphaeraceae bacterium]